jgi:hypothetical protein
MSVARRLAKQYSGRLEGFKSGLEHADTATWQEAEQRPMAEQEGPTIAPSRKRRATEHRQYLPDSAKHASV